MYATSVCVGICLCRREGRDVYLKTTRTAGSSTLEFCAVGIMRRSQNPTYALMRVNVLQTKHKMKDESNVSGAILRRHRCTRIPFDVSRCGRSMPAWDVYTTNMHGGAMPLVGREYRQVFIWVERNSGTPSVYLAYASQGDYCTFVW